MFVRKLNEDDCQDYKNIRIEALRLHPDVFGAPLSEAIAYTDAQWRGFLSQTETAFFGLFDDDELVGSGGLFLQDASSKTGILIGGYIRKEYRGQGFSKLIYQKRIEWARESGLFDRLVVGHKKGNTASKAANQAFGFQPIGEIEYEFGDGRKDINVQYELRLK